MKHTDWVDYNGNRRTGAKVERGNSICSCCGSRYGGKAPYVKRFQNGKGITVYEGRPKHVPQVEKSTTHIIETKNGPLTVLIRGEW